MSTDDESKLLQELGALVRASERTHDAERLERLSHGELSGEELAALQARATNDDAMARALSAHTPLGADLQAQLAARLVQVARARKDDPVADVHAIEDAPLRSAARGALPARKSKSRPWVAVFMPLSVAAAAALWLTNGGLTTKVAEIPAYSLQVAGEQAEQRSAPGVVAIAPGMRGLRIGRDTQLRLLLRPATAVTGDVTAVAFLSTAGELVPWSAQISKAESGALQVVLVPPTAAIAAKSELRVIVGRAALLAAHAEDLARGAAEHGDGFQRWSIPLITTRE